MYNDGQSCSLLVSADGPSECPLGDLSFCDKTVVVTSPNLKGKPALKNWQKQALAEQFVAPPRLLNEPRLRRDVLRLDDQNLSSNY